MRAEGGDSDHDVACSHRIFVAASLPVGVHPGAIWSNLRVMSKLRTLAATGGVFLIGSIFGATFHKQIKGAINFTVGGLGSAVAYLSSLVMTRKKKFIARMFGLDQAGKTTLLFQMKLGCLVPTISTVGFNAETISIRDIDLEVWDFGGSAKLRPLWHHYFADTDVIIFVVNCSERERLDEAREELHRIIADPDLKDAVLLVFANKLDLPGAASAAEAMERMGLQALRQPRAWRLVPVDALTGDGVRDGLFWVAERLAHG